MIGKGSFGILEGPKSLRHFEAEAQLMNFLCAFLVSVVYHPCCQCARANHPARDLTALENSGFQTIVMKLIQKQKRSLAKEDIIIHSVLSATHRRTNRILEETSVLDFFYRSFLHKQYVDLGITRLYVAEKYVDRR